MMFRAGFSPLNPSVARKRSEPISSRTLPGNTLFGNAAPVAAVDQFQRQTLPTMTPFIPPPLSPTDTYRPVNLTSLAPFPLPETGTANGTILPKSVALPVPEMVIPPPPLSVPPPSVTAPIFTTAARPVSWVNDLKQLFHKNQAVIYAINLRTFGAEDKNGDKRISPWVGENGTFLSAIGQLDELAALGVNTLHLLPINPIGRFKRFGDAGSLYAPSDYHRLNPEFDTPGNNLDVMQEARIFVNEAHKRGIHVMVDVPSCASVDLAQARPDLILRDAQGKTMTPTNWVDIVMFKSDKALQDYYEGFFDLMANQVGVDGFRVDVARARPPAFWQHFIGKYPDKAWLAETYTEEDQSPLKNLPRDIPEDLMKSGFDSMYGQFHIFPSMANAKEYTDYLLSNRAMFQRASAVSGNGTGDDKSFIGSFLTHDDPSMMEKGGALVCILSSGLMTTQPWTNPYILDGFTTGYTGDFDIFNFIPRHVGSHPEIGLFMRNMLALRKQYADVLTQGNMIPIPVQGSDQVIAFARQSKQTGKTFLIVANKDLNARQIGTLKIPDFSANQTLMNLAPEYGRPSRFVPGNNQLQVNLGPGRFHMFEIDTPNLSLRLPTY
jgi:hypothetical protein